MPIMNTWLKVKTFLALYVLVFGLGLTFGHSDVNSMVGALLVSLGLRFLIPFAVAFALALRQI